MRLWADRLRDWEDQDRPRTPREMVEQHGYRMVLCVAGHPLNAVAAPWAPVIRSSCEEHRTRH